MTGLEPAASGVTGRRSNQLSYTRVVVGGKYDTALPLSMAERHQSDIRVQKGCQTGWSAIRSPSLAVAGRIGCANRPHPGWGPEGDAWPDEDKGESLEWWAMTGSNRRPSRCKRDALPLS